MLLRLTFVFLLASSASAATSSFDQAEAALADGDFKRAQSLASTVANSGDTDALLLKAETSLAVGDQAAAAAALERAAKNMKPSQARALEQRAQALRQAVSKPVGRSAQLASKPASKPTPEPTPEPAAVSTPEPTALPTAEPTPQPTAAPSADPAQAGLNEERRALEAERAKLAEERARLALETERQALEAEKRQLEEERRRLTEARTAEPASKPASGLPQSGLGLIMALRQPDFTKEFESMNMPPMDVGLKFRFGGLALETGVFATDLGFSVSNTGGGGCPTCPMDQQNEFMSITAPWVALGYDVMPWAPQPGQARAYVPVGVRFTLNYGNLKGETYLGSAFSAHLGLGLRWRLSRRFGLDFSGRFNVHLMGETFDSDNGNQLRTMNNQLLVPDMSGPEARLGMDFYLW